MDKQILFHGSDVIVEHPLVNLGRKDLDFGTGFYLTPLFEQASQWATRVRTIRKAERAIVNVYEFTSPANCRIKRFDSYDKEWLDFKAEPGNNLGKDLTSSKEELQTTASLMPSKHTFKVMQTMSTLCDN